MSLNFDAHVIETDFLEGRKTDNQLTRIGFTDSETGSTSSNREEELIWLDDYKCSLCGVELPSSFVEERQEHSDFHLAEKLQGEEESGHNYISHLPVKHRYFHTVLFRVLDSSIMGKSHQRGQSYLLP